MKKRLPVECQKVCECAMNQFEMVCTQLEEKSLIVMDLKKIMKMVQQMEKLCRSANAPKMTTDTPEYNPIEVPMIRTMRQRIYEFNLFKMQKESLLYLCQMIGASHHLEGKHIFIVYNVPIIMKICINYWASEPLGPVRP